MINKYKNNTRPLVCASSEIVKDNAVCEYESLSNGFCRYILRFVNPLINIHLIYGPERNS